MNKVYIIVGNDGFPRFADPEAEKIYLAATKEDAIQGAKDMVKELPNVVFGVYSLEAYVFSNGQDNIVVNEDGRDETEDKAV